MYHLVQYMPLFLGPLVPKKWHKYGTGDNHCMWPIHQALTTFSAPQSKALLKAHILTGEGCLNKVGTNNTALHFTPEQYFLNFGENKELSHAGATLAEEHLVNVSACVRSSKTFDELWIENM